jgi:hypothetical protein
MKVEGWVGAALAAAVLVLAAALAGEAAAAEIGYFDADAIERRMSANRLWVERLHRRLEGLREAGLVEGTQDAAYRRVEADLLELDTEYADLEARLGAIRRPSEPLWQGREPAGLKGEDWAGFTETEKEVLVFVLLGTIEDEGTQVKRPTGFYVDRVAAILAAEPSFKAKTVKQILRYAVHESE